MAAHARAKSVGISAKKMRLVCDLVRGKNVETAVNTLRFTISPSAHVVLKTLNSAVANAEANELMNRDNLTIIRITVDRARACAASGRSPEAAPARSTGQAAT